MAISLGLTGDEKGFRVQPLTSSAHLKDVTLTLPGPELSIDSPCSVCGAVGDNLLCLGDNTVLCSRNVNGCMAAHATSCRCPLALSFLDLSIWDYGQDAYLDMFMIPEVQPHFQCLHKLKFGELAALPSSSRAFPTSDSMDEWKAELGPRS